MVTQCSLAFFHCGMNYCIAQKYDGENFNEWGDFDNVIVGFIGEASFKEKVSSYREAMTNHCVAYANFWAIAMYGMYYKTEGLVT